MHSLSRTPYIIFSLMYKEITFDQHSWICSIFIFTVANTQRRRHYYRWRAANVTHVRRPGRSSSDGIFNKPHLYNGNLRGPATLTTSPLYFKGIYAQPCVPKCNTNFTYKLEWWFDLYIWNHYLCLKIYWPQRSHTYKPKGSLTLFERHK